MIPASTTRRAAWIGALALAAAGCGTKATEPPIPRPFPTFSLVDVNPNSPSHGLAVTQSALSGPAGVVYFAESS